MNQWRLCRALGRRGRQVVHRARLQCDGAVVTTIEGLAANAAPFHPMQAAFREHHALQCGYCMSGMVLMALDVVCRLGVPDEVAIQEQLKGNICRCTGYHNIVKAIAAGAKAVAAEPRGTRGEAATDSTRA